jgi:putative peptidoglycan lipid II flippase
MLALSISELRKLALGFFATSLPALSLVVMQLALQLMTIPIRFFGVPISQASLPLLSEESDEFDRERFKGLVLQLLHQISFFTMPMSVLILVLRVPIVRLVFGTANFPWATTLLTSRVLAVLAVSITAQSLVHLMLRAFYALKNTNLPFIIAGVDMILYLIAGYYFVFYTSWGVLGLAFVTSITAFVEFGLFLFLLERAVHGFAHKEFWIPQIKMIVASFLMAVFLYLPFKIFDQVIFDTSRTIELIGLTITTSTIGILVYFYFAALFDIHELEIVMKLVNKFGAWRVPLRKTDEVLVDAGLDRDEL